MIHVKEFGARAGPAREQQQGGATSHSVAHGRILGVRR
jgi:hypothetical protein